MRCLTALSAAVVLLALVLGCSGAPKDEPRDDASARQPASPEGAKRAEDEPEPPKITNEDELRRALSAKNPGFWGDVGLRKSGSEIVAVEIQGPAIRDISPLRGMPLEMLGLEKTSVKDLEPLRGMPLKTLGLNNTEVADLGPLEGAPLVMLYAPETKVSDLRPLAKVPTLQQLWLNRCPVRDISPLKGLPLVSLTLDGTDVEDLSPLEGSSIQRLQIVDSKVSDLSVLKTLPQLSRLVFTPGRIKKGIEAARGVPKIGTSINEADRPGSGAAFWARYDAGEFK